ncbi:MAG: anaerobic ribonucleoside-triphosphate reductase activating protein [Bacilli bacterium]|jgi:anaerobic ribonucleoside-triphosphate reductase activating protein|nr:anaerobic ribonucleoside-triphosphate reductase activating protein [Bacilli bacterium]
MEIRLAAPLQYDSIVDGEGLRAVLWTQGCPHNCKGCHNPKTHSFKEGYLTDTMELIEELNKNIKYQDGITLSGGDPFMQPKAVNEIAKYVKSIDKNVWAYTGFEFEQLLEMSEKNNSIKELLNNIDVLIDGKFKIEELSLDLYYRGSRNQRVINVKESLKQNQVILIEKFMKDKQIKNLVEKKKYVFV